MLISKDHQAMRGRVSGAPLAARVAALVASLVPCSSVLAQHIQDGHLVFPERRITAFVYQGADEAVLRTSALRITTREGDAPGSWVHEWRTIAEYYERVGDEHAQTGNRRAALDSYMKANVYYALAWFPGNSTPEESRAYASQLSLYQKAGAYFDVPLEVVRVPFRDGTLVTYVHRPAGVVKPPLVIWSGGSDQYKANHYRPIQALNAKGLAVVTFDLPGFGESQAWPSEPTADEAHVAIMEYFAARGDFDAQRTSFVGISWGGYFATRMAIRNDPRVKAVAALCAPVHAMFAAPVDAFRRTLAGPERLTLINLAQHLHVDPNAEAIQAALQRFSLRDSGLLGQGKTVRTPLLVVDGTRDGLVPVTDLRLAYESAQQGDLWLLARGDHCAVEYWPVMIPQLADWLVEKISQ
jgi:esterase FrsA